MGNAVGTERPLCFLLSHDPHLVVAVFLPHVLDDEVGTVNDWLYVLVELLLTRIQRCQTWGQGGWVRQAPKGCHSALCHPLPCVSAGGEAHGRG